MLKHIIITTALVSGLLSNTLGSYNRLSNSQKTSLKAIYKANNSSTIGLTLAAIGWHESQAGAVRINTNFTLSSPSVDLGFFHLNSKSFLARYHKENKSKKQSHYVDNLLLHKIMSNDVYASQYALKELSYWLHRRGNLDDAIRSYNCGNNIDRDRCDQYLNAVKINTLVLRKALR